MPEALLPVARPIHHVALLPEPAHDELTDARVVLDQEEPHAETYLGARPEQTASPGIGEDEGARALEERVDLRAAQRRSPMASKLGANQEVRERSSPGLLWRCALREHAQQLFGRQERRVHRA